MSLYMKKIFFLNVSWAAVFKIGLAVTRKAIFDGLEERKADAGIFKEVRNFFFK